MSLTSLSQNVAVAFLGSICLALLINEWLSLKASWTELTARGQLLTSLTFLFLATFLLCALQWVLVLSFGRAIATDMELDTTSTFSPDNIDVLDGHLVDHTPSQNESDTK